MTKEAQQEQRTGPMSDRDERQRVLKPILCAFLNTSPDFTSTSSLGLCAFRSRDTESYLPYTPFEACTLLDMVTQQMLSAIDWKFLSLQIHMLKS